MHCRVVFSFFLVAIPILLELISMDTILPIVTASPFDRSIIQAPRDREQIGTNNNIDSTGVMQGENDKDESMAIPSEGLTPDPSLLLSSSPVSNDVCVTYDNTNRTIRLCDGSVDLSTIDQIVNNSSVLNTTSNKNWILNANILIENGATLFLNSTDTHWLRINSTTGTAYSIVVYGNLIIDRTKISSWNYTNNTETVLSDSANKSTPRGYLLMHWGGTGHMNITNSNINNLGFNSLKDTWGMAYYSGSGSVLQNNSISDNFRGIYLSKNASNIFVANNTIENSSQHGLNLYKANGAIISDNKISNNKEHGIFCTRECENILIKSNSISNNGRNGIVLNQDTINSTVKQNVLQENNRSGLAIWNSTSNRVDDNFIQQNGLGITIAKNSSHNIIDNNSIADSLSSGLLLDTNSTNNRIEKNLISSAGGSGVYIRYASDNALARNNITENSKSGMVLLNATKNNLVSNNVYANIPYNYYIRPNSTFNVIRDTYFDNSTLRFFDNSSNIILENSDNRITANNKKVPIQSFSTNATLLLEPSTKNILVNTLDMLTIPSAENVQIYSISKDFNTNQKYKKWLEKSPVPSSMSDDKKDSTRYIVGSFPPDTQIMINVNNSFWNAYTSNSSGYIDFVYDGYEGVPTGTGEGEGREVGGDSQSYRILEFQAEASNRPAVTTIIFFAILIAGSATFISIRRYLKKQKISN